MDLPSSLIETRIVRGAILYSTMFKNIDHGKFFVIIGVSEDEIAGFFFVNSNINKYIFGKQAQLDMQYPMRHADYNFLRYDSFISATNIMTISKSQLAETVRQGITRFVDTMKEEHVNELLEKARESILFSKVEKEKFLY